MHKDLIGFPFSTRITMFLSILLLALVATPLSHGADASRGKCSTERSVRACVISAALTGAPWQGNSNEQRAVTVSVTLKITNTTDFPIDLAFSGSGWGAWSLTPQNAEAITNQGSWNVSGISACDNTERCAYTTLAPGTSSLAQVHYIALVSTAGLPLIEVATTAAFTCTLIVVERGKPRLVSLALDEFTFGNALPNARR